MKVKSCLNPAAVKFLRSHLRSLIETKRRPKLDFDMGVWAAHTEGAEALYGEPSYNEEHSDPPEDVCGTALCLGAAVVLGMTGQLRIESWLEDAAEEILIKRRAPLVKYMVRGIWYVGGWPNVFQERYWIAKTRTERASAALDMFDHFLGREVPAQETPH